MRGFADATLWFHLLFHLCRFDVSVNNVSSPGETDALWSTKWLFAATFLIFSFSPKSVPSGGGGRSFPVQPLECATVPPNSIGNWGRFPEPHTPSNVNFVIMEEISAPCWSNAAVFLSLSWPQVLHLHTPTTTRCTLPRCTPRLTPRLSLGRPTTPPLLLTLAAPASEFAQHRTSTGRLKGNSWPGFPDLYISGVWSSAGADGG